MAAVASQLIEEVTAHEQCDSLEDAREICADGTYFPNNLRKFFGCKTKVSHRRHSCNCEFTYAILYVHAICRCGENLLTVSEFGHTHKHACAHTHIHTYEHKA